MFSRQMVMRSGALKGTDLRVGQTKVQNEEFRGNRKRSFLSEDAVGGWKKGGGWKTSRMTPLPKRGFGPPLVRYVFHPPQVSVLCFSCTRIHDRADQKLFWRGPKIFGRARSLVRFPPPIRFAPPRITAQFCRFRPCPGISSLAGCTKPQKPSAENPQANAECPLRSIPLSRLFGDRLLKTGRSFLGFLAKGKAVFLRRNSQFSMSEV